MDDCLALVCTSGKYSNKLFSYFLLLYGEGLLMKVSTLEAQIILHPVEM